MEPVLSLIVAVAQNGAIGRRNELPWYLPEDLRYFKKTTQGHPVLMGRATFESILKSLGKPLPGRLNLVLSRSSTLENRWGDAVRFCGDLRSAVAEAQRGSTGTEIFVIGGASVYAEALPLVKKLYLTRVPQAVTDADAFFPLWPETEMLKKGFRVLRQEKGETCEFVVYERTQA